MAKIKAFGKKLVKNEKVFFNATYKDLNKNKIQILIEEFDDRGHYGRYHCNAIRILVNGFEEFRFEGEEFLEKILQNPLLMGELKKMVESRADLDELVQSFFVMKDSYELDYCDYED